jgi:hypothetical protein
MPEQLGLHPWKFMRQTIRVEEFEHFKAVFRDGDVGDVGVPFV